LPAERGAHRKCIAVSSDFHGSRHSLRRWRRAIAALPFRTIRKAGFAGFVGDGSGAGEHAAGSAVEEAIFEHQNADMLCWLGPARSVGYDNWLEIENWCLP